MIGLTLKLNGDGAFEDLRDKPVIHLGSDAKPIQVAILDHGMSSGRPSVCIRLDLPDGQHVLAETSARLFCTAGRAILAKYPDLFDGD
ncbi:MAG TPA: hypothetical protein VEU47_11095 [Candidatus Cybelea sp.]|nr:hypothetical protein [Candidatus Cybelea sp.]